MTVTLPITCRQLAYLVLVGLFVIGNAMLIPTDYSVDTGTGFIGWLLTALAIVFGFIAIVIYIDDNKLIRCKCERK